MDRVAGCYVNLDSWNLNHRVADSVDRVAGCLVNLDSWNLNRCVVGYFVNLGSWNSNHRVAGYVNLDSRNLKDLVADFVVRFAGCFVNLDSWNLKDRVAGCFVNLDSWNLKDRVVDFVDRVAGCFANRDSWSLGGRAVAGLVLRSLEGFAVRWESPADHRLARRKGNRLDFEVRVSVCLQTLASVAECLENLGFLVRVLGYHH